MYMSPHSLLYMQQYMLDLRIFVFWNQDFSLELSDKSLDPNFSMPSLISEVSLR